MILQPVPPDRLHDLWGWIRDGLWRVKDRCNESWLPEDVIYQLGAKAAFLYAVQDKGFLVLQKHTDADGLVLFVWIIHGDLAEYEQQIYADLDEIARGMGAKRVRAWSPRKGWSQRGYFKMKSYIYEREL